MTDRTMRKILEWLYSYRYIFALFGAGILSVYGISEKSIWMDEALTLRIAAMDWGSMWQTLMTTEPYRWLYYSLLHFWMRIGSGDAYYRLLSVVFAWTAIPGMYVLGRTIRSPGVGGTGAFLLAVHPMFHRYAQEVHSYSLLLSLTIWSSYLFVLFMRRPTAVRMAVYVLCTLGMIYTHSFGIFVLVSHYISLVYIGRLQASRGLYITSVAILLFAMLPLIMFPVPYQNIAWINVPGLADIVRFILLISGGHAILSLGFIGLFAYGLFYGLKIADKYQSRERSFFVIWLLFPVIAVLAVSVTVQPIFVPRYLIIILPALLILASYNLAQLSKITHVTLLLGASVIMLCNTLYWHTDLHIFERLGFVLSSEKEDWRGAANYIQGHDTSSDGIIFYPYFVRYPFEYYWKGFGKDAQAQIYELSAVPYTIGGIMPEPRREKIADISQHSKRIWLIVSHQRNALLQRERQSFELMQHLESIYTHKDQIHFTGVTVISYY